MKDLIDELNQVHRSTADREERGRQVHEVRLSRTYDAEIGDVWSACTEPDRLARWFAPVSGDLRLGGSYQIEGNAGGEILECEPLERFKLTWIFGDPGPDPLSEVEIQLAARSSAETTLTLTHVAVVEPEFWDQFGPGAVGVGYDLSLMGLAAFLSGIDLGQAEEFETKPEAREFLRGSVKAWGDAYAASGAPADAVAATVAGTTNFYVPPLDAATSEG